MNPKINSVLVVIAVMSLLNGCEAEKSETPTPVDFDYQWQLVADDSAVVAGFADYPVGQDSFYELASGWQNLPAPLTGRGYQLSGNNHSDDLFMFVKRKLTGLEKNARYDIHYTLRVASNAGKNCAGVGGAPGEGVTLKIGLTRSEPHRVQNGSSWLMNIDKGNQAIGGADAIAIGDLATVESNCNNTATWMYKTIDNHLSRFTASTDDKGELWLLIGSDSGYESTSTFYIMNVAVQANRF